MLQINASNTASFEDNPDIFQGFEDSMQEDMLGDFDAAISSGDGVSDSLRSVLQAAAALRSGAVATASSSETESRSLPIDFKLYKLFWGIQVPEN